MAPWLERAALFLVYFWFGLLKLVGLSPATELVRRLHAQTLPFFPFDAFLPLFSLFEVAIGMLFLVPRLTRLALVFVLAHVLMTAAPLILLPELTWQGPFVPTLEGQYIIKNILIVALAVTIVSRRAR
jgi:uncharacterized membrane protein YkgB